jgi:SEC-C motif-containing protein
MRLRYTAFATQTIDDLLASHHPDTHSEVSRADVERFSRDATWFGLEILSTEEG